MLTPAACYPVYPAIAAARAAAAGAACTIDAGGSYVFRHEPSGDPARLQMFHQREYVRIGDAGARCAHGATPGGAGLGFAARRRPAGAGSTSPPTRSSARGGRLVAASQRDQALKFELLVPIAGARADRRRLLQLPPGALRRGVRDRAADGAVAHTACLGFGLERDRRSRCSTRTDWTSPYGPGGPGELRGCERIGCVRPRPDPPARGATTRRPTATPTSLIELLHARGHEPGWRCWRSPVAIDFEGDQWTFLQPAPGDLERLYGVDVHEMQPVGAPARPDGEQLRTAGTHDRRAATRGFLPDTAGHGLPRASTSRRSIAARRDRPRRRRRLRYFHNPGLHELGGEDYRGVLARRRAGEPLTPYTELVRVDPRRRGRLRAAARELLARSTCAPAPPDDPFDRFGRGSSRPPDLLEGRRGLPRLRVRDRAQVGAAFELLQTHAGWLLGERVEPLDRIVEGSARCSRSAWRGAGRSTRPPRPPAWPRPGPTG